MENVNFYEVRVDGNKTVFTNFDKKPCLRYCQVLSKRGKYVELFYHYASICVLIDYWN